MKPSHKSPTIESFLEDNFSRTSSIQNNKCVFCKSNVNIKDFRDELSIKEYKISGLCMKCQDKMFE